MNPQMQTTLLNTYPPKLIATILQALREQLKETDKGLHAHLEEGHFVDMLNAVEEIGGTAPEIPHEYDQNLERRRKILG